MIYKSWIETLPENLTWTKGISYSYNYSVKLKKELIRDLTNALKKFGILNEDTVIKEMGDMFMHEKFIENGTSEFELDNFIKHKDTEIRNLYICVKNYDEKKLELFGQDLFDSFDIIKAKTSDTTFKGSIAGLYVEFSFVSENVFKSIEQNSVSTTIYNYIESRKKENELGKKSKIKKVGRAKDFEEKSKGFMLDLKKKNDEIRNQKIQKKSRKEIAFERLESIRKNQLLLS